MSKNFEKYLTSEPNNVLNNIVPTDEVDGIFNEALSKDIKAYSDLSINYRDISITLPHNKPATIFISSKESVDNIKGNKFTSFILQGMSQIKTEKVQLSETFIENNPAIFFFGNKINTYSFTGKLITAIDSNVLDQNPELNPYDWSTLFQKYWDDNLRGTKLVEKRQIANMVVDGELLQGYPINLNIQKNSMDPVASTFSMSWIITNHVSLFSSNFLNEFKESYNVERNLFTYFRRIKILSLFLSKLKEKEGAINAVKIPMDSFEFESYPDPFLGKLVTVLMTDSEGRKEYSKDFKEAFTNTNFTNITINNTPGITLDLSKLENELISGTVTNYPKTVKDISLATIYYTDKIKEIYSGVKK